MARLGLTATSSRAARSVSLVAAVALLVAACGRDGDSTGSTGADVAGTVTVFAAASLTEAFDAIAEGFSAEFPDVRVEFNFAGSSALAAQLVEGAPADVFASADLDNMRRLVDAEQLDGEPIVFARNLSQIIVEPGNPLGIAGVADLVERDLVLVTCSPEVPCGAYAAQIFENAGVSAIPDSYEQNVKAVVTKVTLGEADAGLAYATDVLAAGDRADGIVIPAGINVAAEYPLALTSAATNPTAARAFVDFVLGAAGQEILAAAGFRVP